MGYYFSGADERLKLQVWNKGVAIQGLDPAMYRRDACGATMRYSDHGNRNAAQGWEIDHIHPQSRGGNDDLSNLQPLHWLNNAQKGDSLSNNYCVRTV